MKAQVNFFAWFRDLAGGKTFEITLNGNDPTLKDLINAFKEQINEKIYKKINLLLKNKTPGLLIMVNGRNISFLNGLETKIKENDKIAIFPPGAGG